MDKYKYFLYRAKAFIQLMRVDKPIGIYLLLWPTLWALWIAAQGIPSKKNLFIFLIGINTMRAAGCVINDLIDKKFDVHVKRTKERPIPNNMITINEAIITFIVLIFISFYLVLLTNTLTILMSILGVIITVIYPFMKRYTYFPQILLGFAYSWGILMAFTSELGELPWFVFLIFFANIFWAIAYDTYYAMVDRTYDLKLGLKSTAIMFGKYDRIIIFFLQNVFLSIMFIVGIFLQMGLYFYSGLLISLFLFIWQLWITRNKKTKNYFKAFINNKFVGMIIFIGLSIDYYIR